MLALEETFFSLCRSSRAIIFVSVAKLSDRCFCYFTAAMFVSLRRTQTWRLHAKLYKFGWHTSANKARMKNSRELILGEVVNISIIYRISDSWRFSLNGYDFYFWSLDWWKPRTEQFRYIRILTWNMGLGDENKSKCIDVEGWIIDWFVLFP